MKPIKEIIESLSVGIILIFVLIPVRIVFVRYVSDDWLGSFGLVTAFSLLIIFLSQKNKLGWFGRAFTRQMFKIHRGKRKYFFYTQLTLGVLFFGGTIYAIEYGDTYFEEEKVIVLKNLEVETMEEFVTKSQEDVRLRDIPLGILIFLYITIFRFDIFAIIMSTLNEISNGWVMHFATVFLVEGLELIGIAFYTKYSIKNPET